MALTQVHPDVEKLESPHRADTPWLQERVPGSVGITVGLSWLVLTQIAVALEPASARPVPLVGVLLEIVSYVLLATMLAGLVVQRRWGLLASLGAAVLLTAGAIACPATGHHGLGAWWFPQMACVLALVGISAVALRRRY